MIGPQAATLSSLRRISPLNEVSLQALERIAVARDFAARDWLLEVGQQATWSFLIIKGLVREFYIGESGAEQTRVFVKEGELTGSLYDLLSGEPSVTWIQALEPTRTLAIPYRDFDAACEQHPDLQRLARRLAEALYVRKARREYEMLALSAAERHHRWLRAHAGIDARLERRQVASYLGITPEHLSRLRLRASRTTTR